MGWVMSPERDPIDELIASVSDGRPVDWNAAERAVPAAARPRIDALRELERIADFSRGLQQETLEAPERWGELVILERIGGGSKAEVFRAWDPALRRDVALKLLRPGADAGSLMDEGRAAARIRHPHVVTVHGIDRRDGRI